jgi:hypothetical protein
MGVEEVLSLIKSHPNDGGANWVFEVLKDSGRYESISSRSQYIQFHAWSSPILCALILQIHEWIQEPMGKDRLPNRVVVIAKMPWIQQ